MFISLQQNGKTQQCANYTVQLSDRAELHTLLDNFFLKQRFH